MRLLVLGFVLAGSPALAQEPYRVPPPVVVSALDAPPLPSASVSPDRAWMVLVERAAMPSIADLAQPMLRLGGLRINPATNGPHRGVTWSALRFKRIADGVEHRVSAPAGAKLGFPSWSPDGRTIAFTVTRPNGIEMWAASAETGRAWLVTAARLNGVMGAPCSWMPDSAELLCSFVVAGRGAAPAAPAAPVGPNTQSAEGRPAPIRTYEDLLQNAMDERVFDYYATAQLGRVNVRTRAVTHIGTAGIFDDVESSPDGHYILVQKLEHPYSYVVPSGLFPRCIEVWDRGGRMIKGIADIPLGDNVPSRGVRPGPRGVQWRPTRPSTLVWAEALDGGDPRVRVPQRDKVMALDVPALTQTEVARTEWRYGGVIWGAQQNLALLTEADRATRRVRTWIIDPDQPAAAPRKLFDRSGEDRYGDPGRPVLRPDSSGNLVLHQSPDGAFIYLTGDGASQTGDRPFLDRLDLRSLQAERLFRATDPYYESIVAVLDGGATRVLTSRESQTEPPNYYVRDLGPAAGAPRAITAFADPAPQLSGVRKELITYRRADGVQLSGTLYTPAGTALGSRLPLILWVYPAEFGTADAASQVRGSPNRFTRVTGASHLFLLTQGYAVLDNPSLPVIGGDTANDSYVQQVVAGAQAAIDKVVDMGIADRRRVGVGGHSYGAFTTANLLAHSDLFRTGIARSGAYNRTLTPFGFQNEERNFWQAPGVYGAMSPFNHADRVNEPILLIHGEADDNSGTFPIQSDRMFAALKGHGATVQLVTYPYEAHGYASRETILDCVARMIEWFDRYVKPESVPLRAAQATP